MKILIIIGTRPNFIKVTRFKNVGHQMGLDIQIAHTSQHYDHKMSGVFFKQFGLEPDYILPLEGNSPGDQMGKMICALTKKVETIKPDYILVPGDVNSTLAGAITAHRAGIRCGHIESGLRSFDRSMPEEVNRILVDQIVTDYFVTEKSGLANLQLEGLSQKDPATTTNLVGNTMIDTLVSYRKGIEASNILNSLGVARGSYILMTMHRPATVDNTSGLSKLCSIIKELSRDEKIVLPLHPRTKNKIAAFGLEADFAAISNLHITPPLDYFSFQNLIAHAKVILTDSGGIQEESTYRKVPCITLRPNTERPITCEIGSNQLVPLDIDDIKNAISHPREGIIPALWDGKSTERILDVIGALQR